MRYWNGSLISSNEHPPSNTGSNGVFDLSSQLIYKSAGKWPDKRIVETDLVFHVDAGNSSSYSGAGTTWTDLSTSGNDGTLVNGPTYGSGNQGFIEFDGIDDYVNLSSDVLNPNSDWSIYSWVNVDSASESNTIVAKASASGALQVRVYNGSVEVLDSFKVSVGTFTGFTASVSTWYNICVTRSSNTYSLYIDGSFVSSFTSSVVYDYGFRDIGNNWNNSAEYFNGKIAVVAAYSRALTASEISNNYNALSARY